MALTDSEFKKLKAGDARAFGRFYDEYKGRVQTYLYYKLKCNEEIAQDIMSETFKSAFLSVRSLKNREGLRSWLYTIALRRYHDYFRKQYREERHKQVHADAGDRVVDVEYDLIEKEKIFILNIALENIRDDFRRVLLLQFYEQKSRKEIADMLNVPESTVAGMLRRARKALQKEFNHLYDPQGNGNHLDMTTMIVGLYLIGIFMS